MSKQRTKLRDLQEELEELYQERDDALKLLHEADKRFEEVNAVCENTRAKMNELIYQVNLFEEKHRKLKLKYPNDEDLQ